MLSEKRKPASVSSLLELRVKGSTHYIPQKDVLKKLREKNGFSLSKVASLCGVSCAIPRKWETGDNKISLVHARILADTYGVPVEALIQVGATPESEYFWADGEKLRGLREKEKLSLRVIAAVCEMDISSVSAWERGEQRISFKTAETVAGYYKIPVEELLIENRPSKPAAPNENGGVSSQEDTKEACAFPKTPEVSFCRNVLFYMRAPDFSEERFREYTGLEDARDYFQNALSKKTKLPLDVVLRTAVFFGKSVEDIVCDDTNVYITAEISALEKQIAELRKMLLKG